MMDNSTAATLPVVAIPTGTTSARASTTPLQDSYSHPPSAMLFYVAVAFGVAFALLWVVIIAKHCCSSSRTATRAGPARPRQKKAKFYSKDELDTAAPITDYKTHMAKLNKTEIGAERSEQLDDDGAGEQSRETAGEDLSPPTIPAPVYNGATVSAVEMAELPSASTKPNANKDVDTGKDNEHDLAAVSDALPTEVVNDSGCSICLDDWTDTDEIRVLPCDPRHFFHVACIDPWLLTKKDCCPLCKSGRPDENPTAASEIVDLEAQI